MPDSPLLTYASANAASHSDSQATLRPATPANREGQAGTEVSDGLDAVPHDLVRRLRL